MLSEPTIKNLGDAFCRAASTTLVRTPADGCSIVAATGRDPGVALGPTILMITISSFVFRLLVVFQVSHGQQTRDYYTAGGHGEPDETFAEVANMCCGAFGRELSTQFKHLAMSIPYGLESPCAAFLDKIRPSFRTTYDISVNDTARMRVTLCLCCKDPIEFTPPAAVEARHVGGELELF